MNFLKRIFSNNSSQAPETTFGRNLERIKTEEQLSHWNQAISSFDQDLYLDSIDHFFHYLADINTEHFNFSKQKDKIQFSFVQGSKKIDFIADELWFRAIVDIIEVKETNIGLLRKLLESSYKLIYGRYCVKDSNIISIIFDGNVQEASPFKLFEGLKEISLRADKEDDLLFVEFPNLNRIHNSFIQETSLSHTSIKYKYYRQWLERALDTDVRILLDKNRYPGASVFIYLSCFYKIDYLLCPEGKAMDIIEATHRTYFEKKEIDLNTKAFQLEKACHLLLTFTEVQLSIELYKVYHTFPITNLISTKEIAQNIEVEFQAMQWYYDFKHFEVCEAICTYIVGSNFFNYTLPRVMHELMHLYFELTDPEYFRELGLECDFNLNSDLIQSSKNLESRCRKIILTHLKDDKAYDAILIFNTNTRIDLLISFLKFIQNFHY
ncbi:MAG: hypothetical protein ABI851_01380 [Saprospiraceae bacterium]